MPSPSDRRSRKRNATRQGISDVATRLFIERGFDKVTIDEIAEAADVGRMTVFNHFPRKEDLFFDRDEEMRRMPIEALRKRGDGISPIRALQLLVHQLVQEESPYIQFSGWSQRFVETIKESESLRARVRAIGEEFTGVLTMALAESAGHRPDDPDAHLTASLFVATLTVAFVQAHRTYRTSLNSDETKTLFLSLVDKGVVGINAMMAKTPYA